MTNALIVVGIIMILAMLAYAGWRSTQTDVVRRKELVRTRLELREARLALHTINRKINVWRHNLDEVGIACVDELQGIIDEHDQKMIQTAKEGN